MYMNDKDFAGCAVIVIAALVLAPFGLWKIAEWLWPILKAAIAAGWAAR